MNEVWVVDDDQSIRFILEKSLLREQYTVHSFKSVKEVLEALSNTGVSQHPDVLISDIRMPEASGISLLSTLKESYPQIPVIIMTAYSDLDSTVSAFQEGAFEYITKPFDLNAMIELVQRAVEERQHRMQGGHGGRDSTAELSSADSGLVGQAPAMQEVFRAIGRLSQSNVTVLITGESGSGKELVAQALHKHSPRSKGPFIAINTAAIPKDLLESELFGHEKGAFTGAQNTRLGRFEQAAGGTLFLDEIGDMSFDLQTRLLRVLSDGRFYRVGGKHAIEADVRVIAATHQDLEEMVKQGQFREDLFHRLNVIRLRLPSLRERREDIPLLTQFFLNMSAQQQGSETKQITKEAQEVLTRFSYPGNVRQLENICHWLNVMVPVQMVRVKDLPPEVLREVLDGGELIEESILVTGSYTFSNAYKNTNTLIDEHDSSEEVKETGVRTESEIKTKAEVNIKTNRDELMPQSWESLLEEEAQKLLANGQSCVWEVLSQKFERTLIAAALQATGNKRIEAANRLGIGRNTITRKIQELDLKTELKS